MAASDASLEVFSQMQRQSGRATSCYDSCWWSARQVARPWFRP